MQHTPPRQFPLWHSSPTVQGWPLSRRWVTSGVASGGLEGEGVASTMVGVGCVGMEALVPGVADGTGVATPVGTGVAVTFVGVGCPVGPAVADAVGCPVAAGVGVPVDDGGGVGVCVPEGTVVGSDVGVPVGAPGVGDASGITHM